jgi:nucleoside-diphosphate-sugar epimerase
MRQPAYLPIDEHTPLQVVDPYAHSKQVDELTSAYAATRYGMTVVALRLPYLGDLEGSIRERSERVTLDPGYATAAREFWTYLDTRDAARACLLGLTEPSSGSHVVTLAAPTTLAPYPTDQLLDAYYPDVPRRQAFPGQMAPFDLSRARNVLRFEADHILDLPTHDFDRARVGARPGR